MKNVHSLSSAIGAQTNRHGELHLNAEQVKIVIDAVYGMENILAEAAAFAKSTHDAFNSPVPPFNNPELTKAAMEIEEALRGN